MTESDSRGISWKTTYREAKGNKLAVTVFGGRELQNYPLVNHLYRVLDGKRISLDQSVHGHDFWQTDLDAASDTYKMSFNLRLDNDTSEWVLTQ